MDRRCKKRGGNGEGGMERVWGGSGEKGMIHCGQSNVTEAQEKVKRWGEVGGRVGLGGWKGGRGG